MRPFCFTAAVLLGAAACREPTSSSPLPVASPHDAVRDTGPTAIENHFLLTGGFVVGRGLADVEVRDGRIQAIGPGASAALAAQAKRIDVTGRFLAPAFIDSHVHLSYLPRAADLAAGGIAAAVGLDAQAVIDSATREPAAYWGFAELGAIAPGKSASLLVLDRDPQADASTLGRPLQVYLRGRPLKP